MAEPTGEHVVRGGKEGGLNVYSYDATSTSPMCGWDTVEDQSGAVGMTGEGGDKFSAAMQYGNHGHSAPGAQT